MIGMAVYFRGRYFYNQKKRIRDGNEFFLPQLLFSLLLLLLHIIFQNKYFKTINKNELLLNVQSVHEC